VKPITVAESPVVPNPHGLDAHRLYASPQVEVVHISLPPGKALVRHASPVDTLIYIIDGTATIESDSERVTAPIGTIVPSPARTMHRVLNETAAQLRFLVVKTPKPTESPVFE
jgi:quercetin dioxygenase-like cupin family protein